jgi:hypothetical protein
LLRHILDEMKDASLPLYGRIIPTSRNIAARNVYRDNGFAEAEPGLWQFAKLAAGEEPRAPADLEQTIFGAISDPTCATLGNISTTWWKVSLRRLNYRRSGSTFKRGH